MTAPEPRGDARPAPPEAAGTIYDHGYERYQGAHSDPRARFWTIARHVVRQAWKSRWGVKLPLILSVVVFVGGGVMMWVLRHDVVEMTRAAASRQGADLPIPGPEAALHGSIGAFSFLGFILTAVVGCRAIADDLRLGSFRFYFARPLRPHHYVGGKILGVALVVGVPMFAGPMLLACVRLLFTRDLADAWAHADVMPRTALVTLVGTASYTIVGLAVGALTRRRAWAQAGFAIYYLILANLITLAAYQTDLPWLSLLSLDANLTNLGAALLGAPTPAQTALPHPAFSAGFTAALVGLGFGFIAWRVGRAERATVGGRT